MIDGLIGTARRLVSPGLKGKPKQSDLRRSISTAYYALFHALAKDGADLFGGALSSATAVTWGKAYRALDHGFAKAACSRIGEPGFPASLRKCARIFVKLREQRHLADYDPFARFTRSGAMLAVDDAEEAIRDLRSASRADRRAFAVHIRMRGR